MSASHDPAPAGNGKWNLPIYVWLGALTIFLVTVATIDLANYRPISGDDGWILSASYKLATQGTLGSDMYAGFFHADEHYFIALPGQHVLQALFLRLFGYGISQARWSSVMSGVALLWAVSILAWRWYGPTVAGLTGVLLLFWQPALVGEGSVPLVSLSRSLRYDLPAVAWIWLTILLLDAWLRRPTPGRSFLIGVATAVATLTQFFGVIALFITPLGVLACRKRQALSNVDIASWCAGFFGLVGPYLLYVTLHWQEALGQTAYLKGERASFGVHALLRNLAQEPRRYQYFLGQIDIAPGPWVLLLGVWPAIAYLAIRLRHNGGLGDRLLALTLLTTLVLLALIDRTKAPIYALPLLPPLCISFALLTAHSLDWSFQRRELPRGAVGITILILFGLTILHGIHFYYRDRRVASSASDYQALGTAVNAVMQSRAAAAGAERWWWPLRNREYLALRNLSLQWHIRNDQSEQTPSFTSLVAENGIQYILVDVIVRDEMKQRPQLLQQQFQTFLDRCTMLQEQWTDAIYGKISLYEVKPACRRTMQP